MALGRPQRLGSQQSTPLNLHTNFSLHLRGLVGNSSRMCALCVSWQDEASKVERKAAKKAVKGAKRLQRAGLDEFLGRKQCTVCSRSVDLLVRCQMDATRQYHMLCGRCWAKASGGRVDGTPETPYYRCECVHGPCSCCRFWLAPPCMATCSCFTNGETSRLQVWRALEEPPCGPVWEA